MNRPFSHQRGVALIIVLAMLILLSGIIVSFMSTAGNERTASAVQSSSASTRQLADSTVNVVISQIRDATSQQDVATTWSSQPGAIRTFSGKVATKKGVIGVPGATQYTYRPGSNDFIYKLYSADQTKVPANATQAWDPEEIRIINQWNRTEPTKDYVDLNEPIFSRPPPEMKPRDNVVEPRYPIIDPRAKMFKGDLANGNARPGIVDGFDIRTSNLDDPRLKLASGVSVPYLPMPVKWIYQLRDGTLTSASDATSDNPIVGRTAWWVDDESTKLNINTASEGTFWDTPSVSSELESGDVNAGTKALQSSTSSLSLGASQPARGEYNRYPGHPATTSLSPVFGWLWNILPGSAPLATRDSTLVGMKNDLGQISPFIPYGNPKGGPLGNTSMGANYNTDINAPADKPPGLDISTKHLYATVDDLLFKQDRFQDGSYQPLLNGKLTPDALERGRFFLTANSRSPEINLFGRPRVTLWPVNAQETQRTAFDDLFAFTSTLYRDPNFNKSNDKPFFFTRFDAKSQINDFSGVPQNASGANRNPKLFKYLQYVTGDGPGIPGFGSSFSQKYTPAERDQILLMIYDYMRSVNLVDTGTISKSGAFQPYTPMFGKDTSKYQTKAARSNDWSGQLTPIRKAVDAPYQGLGRFFTISEPAMIFYRVPPPAGSPPGTPMAIQAALAFGLATPMPGFPIIRETFFTKVEVRRPTLLNIEKSALPDTDIKLVGEPPLRPTDRGQVRINVNNVSGHDVADGRNFMPMLGFAQQMHYFEEPSGWTDSLNPGLSRPVPNMSSKATPKKFEKHSSTLDGAYRRPNQTVQYYPYVSDPFPVPAATKTDPAPTNMTLKAGAYDVQIWSGEAPDDPRAQLVQTVHLDFAIPRPQKVTDPVSPITLPIPGKGKGDTSFQKRLTGDQDSPQDFFNSWEDTIRGLVLVTAKLNPDGTVSQFPLNQQGDIRLAMPLTEVPAGFYQPRRGAAVYNSNTQRDFVMHRGHGEIYPGATGNTSNSHLVTGGRDNGKVPILPDGVDGVFQTGGAPGDFDRGLSKHVDGAFANKVDEGNVYFGYSDNGGGKIPYYRGRSVEETGRSFFSPNRQISSPVMLGSIPTGVVRGLPWQTLLFRPDRGTFSHPGAQTTVFPADHLLLDLFHLPIVEPYAISEPFSTAGKVNLNYVIAPFGYAGGDQGNIAGTRMARSYVRRDTALRGVLKAVKIMLVKSQEEAAAHAEDPLTVRTQFRWDIDADKTLDLFEDRLKDPQRGLFRSASEICDMDLYPAGTGFNLASWTSFWDTTYAATGDNMRERPYSHIYPRVTTKSNVFTVHMRCQSIKKSPGTKANEFVEGRDQVTSEYRGSAVIERFIDPNDPKLKDYDETNDKVDPFYRFRVVATKQFAPR